MNRIEPNWLAPANIKAFTTVKSSWGYPGTPYQSESSVKALLELGPLPNAPHWINQTHSNIALPASSENIGKTADASFTHEKQRVCAVLTADCLPILICNKAGTAVAAIHAGWRGLANGIIENTLKALNEPAENLIAWMGPAIGPAKFEVGKDVYDAFTAFQPEAKEAFLPHNNDKWLANLYLLATQRLNLQGVTNISGGEYCTHSQSDLFYSYRRDQGQTGRMVSVIWIE